MGDPLKKVQPGDPLKIPAETFNTFIDAAADFKARTRGFVQKATPQAPQRTIIPIKNMSGADRQRFDVLEISEPLFDLETYAGKERPMAVGVKPGGPSGKIAVLLEPAKTQDIARACVSGVTVARVDLKEKWHDWVDLKKDECEHLESRAQSGAGFVLWSTGETGTQLVLLKISNPPPVHFPARITSVTWETGFRYKYGFQEVEKKAKEWDGWQNKAAEDGGRSGTSFNLIETVNAADCAPARVGEIVWMEEVRFTGEDGQEKNEYWFQYEEYADPGDSSGDSSGGGSYIDVVVCDPWNRCGSYLVFPQKRIYLPPGATITDLPPTVVPIYECQSSGGSSGDDDPDDGSGGSSGDGEDWWIWWDSQFEVWSISPAPGATWPGYWIGTSGGPGTGPDDMNPYTSGGSATGQATVTDVSPYGYAVSGTLSPDATGNYLITQVSYNSRPTWKRQVVILP